MYIDLFACLKGMFLYVFKSGCVGQWRHNNNNKREREVRSIPHGLNGGVGWENYRHYWVIRFLGPILLLQWNVSYYYRETCGIRTPLGQAKKFTNLEVSSFCALRTGVWAQTRCSHFTGCPYFSGFLFTGFTVQIVFLWQATFFFLYIQLRINKADNVLNWILN
jgi:hypothetical protein